MYTTCLNHFYHLFLGLTIIVIAYKLTFVVIDNAFLFIFEEAFLQLILVHIVLQTPQRHEHVAYQA